jgi:hypothetical protein
MILSCGAGPGLPAFFVIGFTLCYTSAWQASAPHGVQVAVAGPAAQTAPLRDGLPQAVGSAFDVQSVPTPAAAAREVRDQDLYGAYVPAAQPAGTATVIVAAASGTRRRARCCPSDDVQTRSGYSAALVVSQDCPRLLSILRVWGL